MLPDSFFYSVITFLNKSSFLVEQPLFISFKGFSGSVSLSRPNSSKKSIAKLNIGVSLCTSSTGPAQNLFHLV